MQVSRHWYQPSKALLYNTAHLSNVPFINPYYYIFALQANKHLLRRVHWRIYPRNKYFWWSELLDILLDHRQPDNEVLTGYGTIQLGPNPPPLHTFVFEGDVDSESVSLFNQLVLNLKSLTTLKLTFNGWVPGLNYSLDPVAILDALPLLKHLSIDGLGHSYVPQEAAATTTAVLSFRSPSDATKKPIKALPLPINYRLESFGFNPIHLTRSDGFTAFSFLERLGNLKTIQVIMPKSTKSGQDRRELCRLGELSRALQLHCPKIERIETQGEATVWLFRLPTHSAETRARLRTREARLAAIPHTAAHADTVVYRGYLDEASKQQEREDILIRQYQGVGEWAMGDAGPYFPQLTTLIMQDGFTLAAQDLLSLAAASSSSFLTHVELGEPSNHAYMWDMHEDADPEATSITYSPYSILVDRRIRRPIEGRDVHLFLVHCKGLRYFSVGAGTKIQFEDLVDEFNVVDGVEAHIEGCVVNEQLDMSLVKGLAFREDRRSTTATAIRPWACEGTLETLKIAIEVSAMDQCGQELVWRQLGRLWRLKSLTLLGNMIPKLQFGIGALEGMKESLESVPSLSTEWEVDDRETMLWFARTFPRLREIGVSGRHGVAWDEVVRGWLDGVKYSFKIV
ncbi:hypothetical protein BGX29_010871 [Mortierella sp. GBA35]|nr:hypothetical protein BGX29_010871 [Mortierella sp. GBA35]